MVEPAVALRHSCRHSGKVKVLVQQLPPVVHGPCSWSSTILAFSDRNAGIAENAAGSVTPSAPRLRLVAPSGVPHALPGTPGQGDVLTPDFGVPAFRQHGAQVHDRFQHAGLVVT